MIAMTMMVRDEADIVGAMIQHHLDQGIDLFLVTDNASVDGTTEILESFAKRGLIELSHDPRHLKQQHEVVTAMSREAARRGATWVLNADADEFWGSASGALSIRDELAAIDPAICAFPVPVVDMTGPPARSGTGLQRLVYRDERPDSLMQSLGIHAHATPDVAFVPHEDVVVAQGNHFVNVEPTGTLPPGRGLLVRHFPWRSWDQFHRKVLNAGRGYEANPHLRPSANHHGMRDYRRLRDGLLPASYVARHPSPDDLAGGLRQGWFVEDRTIADVVPSPVPDVAYPEAEAEIERAVMRGLLPIEARLRDLEASERVVSDRLEFELRHVAELDALVARLREENAATIRELADLRRSRLVRSAERLSRWRRRGR